MGIGHLDDAEREEYQVGHLRGAWTGVGEAAGSVELGCSRLQVADGGWATPAHEHGREEEIFYILAGRGLWWHDGRTAEIGAGDCIACLPGTGAHTLHGQHGLDVLAFGSRYEDEAPRFPRIGLSRVGNRVVETAPGSVDGFPAQWLRESELGAPELPAVPDPRPASIVNVDAVEAVRLERPRVVRTRRNLGHAVGSVRTGLQQVEVEPGKLSAPQHCHSLEEELFVVLSGDGSLLLGDEELPIRAGHIVSRPAGTGISHAFRGGSAGLAYLAYGTREPNDVCYYPRSNKISFRGVGVIARLERLDYWDGED